MDRADDAQLVGVERLAQTRVESIVVDTRDMTQEAGIDPTAVHRGQPQQIASRNGREHRRGRGEDRSAVPGEPLVGLQKFLDVQRNAFRPPGGTSSARCHERPVVRC
jgi:hypothetical protein